MALTNEDLLAISQLLDTNLDAKLGTKLAPIENKLSSIEMTLENETNRNISIIAEAHSELNQKLDEALKVENEKELLLIRVNHMENVKVMQLLT